MMATTHALMGLLAGLALAPLSPGGATALALAGLAGGLAPDLDVLGAHRRTLHFPIYGSIVAAIALAVALATAAAAAFLAAAFVAALALHSLSDALGGGRSLRPWAEPVDRGVYCHAQGRWWAPRGLIPYDGSAPDLALVGGLGLVALAVAESAVVRSLVAAMLVVSIPYAAIRRRLPDYAEALPEWLRPSA